MWKLNAVAIVTILAATSPMSAEEHRELGPHEHGHGTLNIAVEGNTIKMELEVPGDDIVGFEHDPVSTEEKAAFEKAKTTLAAPLALFKIPETSKCSVTGAKVTIQEEHQEHEEEAKTKTDGNEPKEVKAHHNEFHVEYALDCKAISDVTTMDFEYFKLFSNAQELDVNVVTPKGQSKFEATRDKPSISLKGML